MNKRLPNVLLSEVVQETACVFDKLLPENAMDEACWVYTPKKPNYDKELLLDFIEWLEGSQNINLMKYINYRTWDEQVPKDERTDIVSQYLEDDE